MSANNVRKDLIDTKNILQEFTENPFHRFNVAFALMSVIPFLVFMYLVTVKVSTLDVLAGEAGVILSVALFISLCGLLVGYGVLYNLLRKVVFYALRAKRDDTRKSDFVATVSHDLRNPISAIEVNLTGLLEGLEGRLNDRQKEVIRLCRGICERMMKLVGDLLNIYKIEAGMQKLDLSDVDLFSLINSQVGEFSAEAGKKDLRIRTDLAHTVNTVRADEPMICEVINNILGNAVKYTDNGGVIDIRLFDAGDFARVEIEDSAECIPAEMLHRIFDKFERHSETKKGAGLGLAIAKDMVELHGGRIWAERMPEKGNKFIFVLPCNK